MNVTIVKRQHHIEPYDPQKLVHSIYSACLAVRTAEGEAEITAKRVAGDLAGWLNKKTEVTSHDIRINAAKILEHYNPNAAYAYQHHNALD